MNRRKYIKSSAIAAGSIALSAFAPEKVQAKDENEPISDSQNSFHEIDRERVDPLLDLKDLATGWVRRYPTQLAAMPGLNNDMVPFRSRRILSRSSTRYFRPIAVVMRSQV